jgi:hypothetical protein
MSSSGIIPVICLQLIVCRHSRQRKSGATVIRRFGQVSLRARPGAQLPATRDPFTQGPEIVDLSSYITTGNERRPGSPPPSDECLPSS